MSEEKQFNIHINTVNGTYLVQGNDDGVKNLIAAINKAKVLGDSIDIPGVACIFNARDIRGYWIQTINTPEDHSEYYALQKEVWRRSLKQREDVDSADWWKGEDGNSD